MDGYEGNGTMDAADVVVNRVLVTFVSWRFGIRA